MDIVKQEFNEKGLETYFEDSNGAWEKRGYDEEGEEIYYENSFGVKRGEKLVDEAMKFDQGKNRLDLIEPKFVEGIGRVLTYGANKYSANNWKNDLDTDRIKAALLRHLYAYLGGEMVDPDTNESHLYHVACNLMFLDYYERKGKKEPIPKSIEVCNSKCKNRS